MPNALYLNGIIIVAIGSYTPIVCRVKMALLYVGVATWRYTCTLFPKADVGWMHCYPVNHLQIFVKATKGKGVEFIPMQAPSGFRRNCPLKRKRHIKGSLPGN